MRHRNVLTAGAIPLALALAAPGCRYEVSFKPVPGGPTFTSFSSASMKESETVPAQRVEVGGTPGVVVENRVGRVVVVAGDEGVVVVEAEKHAATKQELAEIKLGVEKKGDVVTVKWDTNEPSIVNRSLDITVKAPKAATLQLHTGNGQITIDGFRRGADAKSDVGAITVKGVDGDLKLNTGNGAISAEGSSGAVVAETGVGSVTVQGSKGTRTVHSGNGAITLDGASGAVSARTDVGRVEVRHAKGDLTLHTGNGAIRVSDADGGLVADTGVGSVEVSGRLSGKCRVETGNGAIVVAIPADSRLKVDADTGNGAITSDFGLPVVGRVSHNSKGTLGDGSGGSLHLQSGVGSISLKKR